VNLDFSDEQKQLCDQMRLFLADKCTSAGVRAILEGAESYNRPLYRGLAEMGVLGAAIPEGCGGSGLTHLELCVVAEELGRALAPVPVSSSICLAAEFLLQAGSSKQKEVWLPQLAAGEAVGTFAMSEGQGRTTPAKILAKVEGGKLTGAKFPVPDGDVADFAVVAARDEQGAVSLYLVELAAAGVRRDLLESIDPTRGQARLVFERAPVELLGTNGDGWHIASQVLDRAAVLMAFEQLGGADRALEMAGIMRWSGGRSAVRSDRSRASSIFSRTCMFPQRWRARTVIMAHGRCYPVRRSCMLRLPLHVCLQRPRSSIAPGTTSRCMVAWALPGLSTATCSTAGPMLLRWR